jgi:hypothetical protein
MLRRPIRLLIVIPLFVGASQADAALSLRTVALTGQSADSGGGDPLNFTETGLATINEIGQVAFIAFAQAEGRAAVGGVWSEGGGQGLRLVALDGRSAPGIAGGIYTGLSETFPLINDEGEVVFRARLVTAPGITTNNNSGIWIADAGQTPTLVLREGDNAPGAPAGAVFTDQTDVAGQRFSVFNNQGQVAMQTRLLIGPGGVTGNTDFGIWRAESGGPTLMVGLEGQPASGISPTRYYGNISATPSMNDLGQVTFMAPLKTTPSGTTNSGSGIWMGDPAVGMTLVARDGNMAPGAGGATFATFTRPALNNAAEYAFTGSLTIGGSVTAENNSAVWVARDGNPLAMLIREADHAPGTGPAVGFSTFDSLRINAAGHTAFRATLAGIPGAGESGVTPLNDSGVWSEGAGGGRQLIVRENDQAPGLPDGVLLDLLGDPVINAAGQIAILCDLRGAGVTSANNSALWSQDEDGVLRLVARDGDAIDVDDGPGTDLRTVSILAFWPSSGGEDGQRSSFNDSGQLVFSALFTDNTSGVFVVDFSDELPGDFNQDGTVDAADYVVWRKSNAAQREFEDWRANFGNSLGTGSGASANNTVPEPASVVLLLLTMVGWSLSQRRTV